INFGELFMSDTKREHIKSLIEELSKALKETSDAEITTLLDGGLTLKPIFHALFDPTSPSNRLYIDVLLENRNRSAIISAIYHSLRFNYSRQVKVNSYFGYISPSHVQ